MQKPQGRENGGKHGFLLKATPRLETCLSLTAITRLDVFSLFLSLTPSTALFASLPTPGFTGGFGKAPGQDGEDPGARGRAGASFAVKHQ